MKLIDTKLFSKNSPELDVSKISPPLNLILKISLLLVGFNVRIHFNLPTLIAADDVNKLFLSRDILTFILDFVP